MNNSVELKSYLMSDFSNNKYKSIPLIDMYVSDNKYYKTLEHKNLIEDEAMSFFHEKGKDVEAASSIPTEAFRKYRYGLIIDEYIEERTKAAKLSKEPVIKDTARMEKDQKTAFNEQSNSQDKVERQKNVVSNNISPKKKEVPVKQLHCLDDGNLLNLIDLRRVTVVRTKSSIILPRYECPICKKRYTSLREYKDFKIITSGKNKYMNISQACEGERYIHYLQSPHIPIPGTKCYVYGISKPVKCRECGSSHILKGSIMVPSKKKKKKTVEHQVRFCENCKMHYLTISVYAITKENWTLLNENEVPEIKEELQRRAEEKAKRKAARTAAKEAAKEAETIKKNEERLKKLEEEKKRKEKWDKERIARDEREKILREQLSKHEGQLEQDSLPKKIQQLHIHDNRIRVKDFVVRRTTFRCRHNDHKLQNIDAAISIINKDGNVIQTKVSAGYCPNCNIFFIMESTYQALKMKGTPICRVSDEKAYLSSSTFVNGMKLAQESVLMQYGYSVSQEESLTSARRKKILALMIDNDVLTRNEIISYLDFFINQRKNQHRFEKAIEKWESDREFVSEYKVGNYTQYGVSGIHRKY